MIITIKLSDWVPSMGPAEAMAKQPLPDGHWMEIWTLPDRTNNQ
jgi:hypothetical protein